MGRGDDEREAFEEAMRDVRRLKGRVDRAHDSARRARPGPLPEEAAPLPRDVPPLEPGEELVFRRPGVSERDLRRLRRGQFPPGNEIDLHGMATDEAGRALRTCLAAAFASGVRCVLVIHGKGLRSGSAGPVLKAHVNAWMRRWDEVLAFCPAKAVHGGTGALYVLLRRSR